MSEPGAEVRAFWNSRASRYDDGFDAESGDAHALRARLNATVRLVGDGPGVALDAGMGPGRLCAELEAHGWTVFGVDAAREMVELARARLPEASERLVEGAIESLPFPDASFDRVIATGVLEYANVREALAELARVLRPEGFAVISYPNPRAPYRAWKAWVTYPVARAAHRLKLVAGGRAPYAAPAVAPTTFLRLLREAGLVPLQRESTSVIPLLAPLDTLLPRATARLAARIEAIRPVRRLLATQIVYVARKPT